MAIKISTFLGHRLFLAVLASVIAIIAKLSLTTGSLLPGIDGAYYWVQVRSVLTDFTLAFDDLPLVFWVQALFSFLLSDIPLGVRISDALLPALAAIPVYWFLKDSKHSWLPAVGVLVVLLHPVQLYFFTGDFIKNAAAIPVAFFIGWILYTWQKRPAKLSILALSICFLILALTHFGTLLMCVMLVSIWTVFYLRKRPLAFWLRSGAIAVTIVASVLFTLAVVVPARFERLLEFVFQPATIFANPFWEMMFFLRPDFPIIFTMLSGQLGSIALAMWAWKIRGTLPSSSLSLTASSLITAFLLSSPLIGIEWASRLIALSFAPLLLAAMVVWMFTDRVPIKATVGVLAISTLVVSLALAQMGAKSPAITEAEHRDLITTAAEFTFPENSLVVSRHGLEYLVAWEMNTHVIQEESYQVDELSAYDSVYLLVTESHVGYAGYTASPITYGYPSGGYSLGGGYGENPDFGSGGKDALSGGEVVYQEGTVTIARIR